MRAGGFRPLGGVRTGLAWPNREAVGTRAARTGVDLVHPAGKIFQNNASTVLRLSGALGMITSNYLGYGKL
jgi:hypothetical protein